MKQIVASRYAIKTYANWLSIRATRPIAVLHTVNPPIDRRSALHVTLGTHTAEADSLHNPENIISAVPILFLCIYHRQVFAGQDVELRALWIFFSAANSHSNNITGGDFQRLAVASLSTVADS
jgi:hypothetical protein